MTTQIAICVAIFLFMIISLALNKLPMGVTACSALLLLVLTHCVEAKDALGNFGNANVIIIVGMFVIGEALSRTSLITNITHAIRKATGGNFQLAYRGILILAVIITSVLTSPMVSYAIVFPILDSICDEFGVSRSKVQFPLAIVCVACCAILPFGFAISEAAVFDGLMETYGFTQHFTALDFTRGRWPMIIVVLIWAFFLAQKFTPEEPLVPIASMSSKKEERKPLTKTQDMIGGIIFAATILGLIFNAKIGIAAWVIVLSGCMLNIIFGVISSKDAIRAMPIDIGMMFVGANAMASALVNTGAAALIGDKIAAFLGTNPSNWMLSIIFFIVPFVLTQFMQNQGVMNIIAPICLLTCSAIGADPRGLLVLICAGSLTAFMTPSATGAIPMMMGAGGYTIKSLAKMGWLIAVLLTIFYIPFITIVMPAF